MSKSKPIGFAFRKLVFALVLFQLIIGVSCLVCSVIFSYNFLAGLIAMAPGVLSGLRLSFISIDDHNFIINRLFRPTLKINKNSPYKVSFSFFSIPGSNVLIIYFKNGDCFSFLAGGKNLDQIQAQIRSSIAPTVPKSSSR